jgi:hypothetical protein
MTAIALATVVICMISDIVLPSCQPRPPTFRPSCDVVLVLSGRRSRRPSATPAEAHLRRGRGCGLRPGDAAGRDRGGGRGPEGVAACSLAVPRTSGRKGGDGGGEDGGGGLGGKHWDAFCFAPAFCSRWFRFALRCPIVFPRWDRRALSRSASEAGVPDVVVPGCG